MSKQNVCNGTDLPVRFDCPNCRCKMLVLALPGVGKTTFAKQTKEAYEDGFVDWSVADVDFGTWRKRKGVNRLWHGGVDDVTRDQIYREFMSGELVPALENNDLVLCNEPGLASYLPFQVPVVTVVPADDMIEVWFSNLVLRTVENYKPSIDSPDFLALLAAEGKQWPRSEAWQIPGALQLRFQSYQDWGQIYSLMELLT